MLLSIVISVMIGLVLNSMLLTFIIVMFKIHEGQHCAEQKRLLDMNDCLSSDIVELNRRLDDIEGV